MKEKRFEKVYTQGAMQGIEIWVDTETGVNYMFCFGGNAGGLTPLLDRDGKPIVTGRQGRPRVLSSRRSSRADKKFSRVRQIV